MAPQEYRALKKAFVAGQVVPQDQFNGSNFAGQSHTEVQLLLANYVDGRGVFRCPELGPVPSCPDGHAVVETLRELASKRVDEIVVTKWPPVAPSHKLLFCWYAKDPASPVASQLADDIGMKLLTVDMCVDKALKLGERVKGGEKLSPPETELAALGNKVAALRAKNGVVPETMISDMVCKATVLAFATDVTPVVGYILVNFPRTKDEAKTFEVEMVRRLTHLSDVDAAARVTQLTTLFDEKNPIAEETVLVNPPPLSSIDWVIFEDVSDDVMLAEALALDDSLKHDEAAKDVTSKAAAWAATTTTLVAFWKAFGCVYTLDRTLLTPFGVVETLHLVVRAIATEGQALHGLQARDNTAFLEKLSQAKEARRQSLPHAEDLLVQELAGERTLAHDVVPDLFEYLSYKGAKDLAEHRTVLFKAFYDALIQLSEQYIRLRTAFLTVLCSQAQQGLIDSTSQRLRQIEKAKASEKEAKKLTTALEVALGDIVDRSRKSGNAFLAAPANWTMNADALVKRLTAWLERLVKIETDAFRKRMTNLNLYFDEIECIPLHDDGVVPPDFQPLMDLLVQKQSTSRFGPLVAPLIELTWPAPPPPRPVTPQCQVVDVVVPSEVERVKSVEERQEPLPDDNVLGRVKTPLPDDRVGLAPLPDDVRRAKTPQDTSETTPVEQTPPEEAASSPSPCNTPDAQRRVRLTWFERATFVRQVLCAVDFVSAFLARIEPLREMETQVLNATVTEYMRQEHAFIGQVLRGLPCATWPRVQALWTPWTGHAVAIEQHCHFLAPTTLLHLAKAFAASPDLQQPHGDLTLPSFGRLVLEVALDRRHHAPEAWKTFGSVSTAALPFCLDENRVDWRRFLLSVLAAQFIPLPRSKHLHALTPPSIQDAWDRPAFLALPFWFNDVDQSATMKETLFHVFADAHGRIPAAAFLLHWCVAVYPLDIVPACHASLAQFPRGLAKAYRLLWTWTPSQPSWTRTKCDLLLRVGRVSVEDPSVLELFDRHGDVLAFCEYCDVHVPSLAPNFVFQNVYDHLRA
ncbi:Aste57867_9011 [Aphanomyces stellatus]|uniref:Aste57867_9011 protein n=1 Tax=Aphanomyces stellatus TaxID=120398 RepID=A0A485KLQ4_9STRA|nr:hypothetical protein As57867_008976 [Aphanomyces stellatus]VFT85895.1 Aste57867_9011 [Aphanomyces stellatus]